MFKKITFEIETITPMFLAGANQSKAELRAASIKGLLRFWWRALQVETDIAKLRKQEGQIFGSSDEGVGGSSFAIRIIHNEDIKSIKDKFPMQNITVTSKGRSFQVNILEYLAYGTLEYKKGEGNIFIREYIPAKTKFQFHLNFTDTTWYHEVLKALYVFSLFGGIGARSRNGFGSFNIKNCQEIFSDLSKYSLDKFINKIEPLPYPSFAKDTKIFKTKTTHNSWDAALAEIGKLYRNIRSGEIKLDNKSFENKHTYDKRQYIGSPLIVDKKEKSFLDRHAKPYFIKVAKEGDKYRGYILYLPSQYCIGLEKDRTDKAINHQAENLRFTKVCTEFNQFLAKYMDTVI